MYGRVLNPPALPGVMPLYEYKCSKCLKHFDVLQKFSDPTLTTHEDCGGEVERLVSPPAFHFKGSGWYVTDYAKTNGNSSPAANGKSEGGSDGKSESKPETKSDSGSESKSESAKPAPASTESK